MNSILLTPGFWFNPMAVPFMPWLERALPIVLAFFGLAAVVALVYAKFGKGVSKELRALWRDVGTIALTASLSGAVLFFFHWQRVPYLSMRVYWLIWLLAFGYWKYAIWRRHFKLGPAERARAQERAAYEKWLPKPKR